MLLNSDLLLALYQLADHTENVIHAMGRMTNKYVMEKNLPLFEYITLIMLQYYSFPIKTMTHK